MGLFKPASRKRSKFRGAFCGPTGAGKTMTAMRMAFALAQAEGCKVAVIDTEAGSASLYEGEAPDEIPFKFDVLELSKFSPSDYTSAIYTAAKEGFGVLIIDSLSHAWNAEGGALDQVSQRGGRYTDWKDVTPQQDRMVQAILRAPMHVFVTMRSHMEYVLEPGDRGQMVPQKVGMAPIQRKGIEYEFSVICDIDTNHLLTVSKTRCSALDGLRVMKPGADFMYPIIDWLNKGTVTDPSYFAATDEELAKAIAQADREATKYAAIRDGIETAGGPPAPSLKEKMKAKAAAKAAAAKAGNGSQVVSEPAQQQPAAEQPQQPQPPFETTTEDASDADKAKLVKRVKEYLVRLQVPVEDQRDALKRRGVKTLVALSAEQLKDMLDVLIAAELGGEQGGDEAGDSDDNQGEVDQEFPAQEPATAGAAAAGSIPFTNQF